MGVKKMRLDLYLSERGLCKSRAAAQSLIAAGGVLVNGRTAAKNSLDVADSDEVTVLDSVRLEFVGRGGLKLKRAVELWKIDLKGKLCVDIGASTGGFTDCMLQNGSGKVFAVDVGTNQLDETLRADGRVISLENTDIRDFSLPEGISADFIGADVSFISLKLILPHIYRLLSGSGSAVALIKPQFEAGRKSLSKRGIVTDERTRLRVVADIADFARQCGFTLSETAQSPITGGSGNVEYLLYLRK
ncbi:MAG: TlyA family RNA methyltransferase [Oscillospiraceae bacterium]|nr:TlyA family RNA methyltransferase [Oscillospiraceae bacterium]